MAAHPVSDIVCERKAFYPHVCVLINFFAVTLTFLSSLGKDWSHGPIPGLFSANSFICSAVSVFLVQLNINCR